MKSLFVTAGFWLLLLINATVPTVIPEMEWPYFIEVRKYEQCRELPNTIVVFRNLKIDRVGKDNYTLTGDVDVTEDLPGPLYMGAKAEKCKDTPTKCVHVLDQVFEDLCADLDNKHSKGYEIMHNQLNFKDPKCPLKKGAHRMASKQFDTQKLQSLAAVAKYWNIKLYFYGSDKKTPNSCVYFELGIKKKNRNREWNMG